MHNYAKQLSKLIQEDIPFVSVTIVKTIGSTPQSPGSKMLVTHDGLYWGTIGGSALERRAIEEAQKLLCSNSRRTIASFVTWSLVKDLGMPCGGIVRLFLETYNMKSWKIVIFGAGHVANAVITLLTKLNCWITCIDQRPQWLAKLPDSPQLTTVRTENMASVATALERDSFVLVLTSGYETDAAILLELLKGGPFPYIGVIGGQAKAVRLKQDVQNAGLSKSSQHSFFCPAGLNLGTKDPEEIAISIVAQLIQMRDNTVPILETSL